MKKNKAFDCVEMMHAGQDALSKRLEGMTRAEILEYYRQGAEELRQEQKKLRAEAARAKEG